MKALVAKRVRNQLIKITGWHSLKLLKSLSEKYDSIFHISSTIYNDESDLRSAFIMNFFLSRNEENVSICDDIVEETLESFMYKINYLCKKEFKNERKIGFKVTTDYFDSKQYWSGICIKNDTSYSHQKIKLWKDYYNISGRNKYISNEILCSLKVFYITDEIFDLLKLGA